MSMGTFVWYFIIAIFLALVLSGKPGYDTRDAVISGLVWPFYLVLIMADEIDKRHIDDKKETPKE